MVIFEFDGETGIATYGFEDYWHPVATLVPEVAEWVSTTCKGKVSIVVHIEYDYLIFGYPAPADDEIPFYTIFFENEMDALKFKLFWL